MSRDRYIRSPYLRAYARAKARFIGSEQNWSDLARLARAMFNAGRRSKP